MTHSKRRTFLFIGAALLATAAAAALQATYSSTATWDFEEKTFEGIFLAEPYPTLISGDKVYYIALETKHGFPKEAAKAHHMNLVRIVGSVIEDSEQPTAMIAVAGPDSITDTGQAASNPIDWFQASKAVTLEGEIADSKCALGAMNPGVFKPHRACAIACLSGGIPPVLIVRQPGGAAATHYLLVGEDGNPMDIATSTEFAALPVTISGQVTSLGTWNILKAAPSAITLIP